MIILLVVVILQGMIIMTGDIDFTPDDRLDIRELGGHVMKVLDPKHITVIRNSNTRHTQLLGTTEEFFDITQAVKD